MTRRAGLPARRTKGRPVRVADSREPLVNSEFPDLNRAVGVLADQCWHVGLDQEMVEVQPEYPTLNTGASVKWVPVAEASEALTAANTRVADRCERMAEELLAHAHRLRHLPPVEITPGASEGEDDDGNDD